MSDHIISAFTKGTWNLGDDENIPKDAAQSSSNWITQDGRLRLVNGRLLIGAEGASGKISGEHFGYKVDGTKIHYRKISTKIQYLNGSTWTDCVTGLTADSDYTFSNYSSLSGAYTYATGIDGIWKFVNSHPASPINVTDSTKNYKGWSTIDKGRMWMWNVSNAKTTLYGSFIDGQDSTIYTTITGEALAAVESGTLAFKAGGATRSCFGVVITDTSSGEVFTDNYLGAFTGSLGGTGTINYATGAFTITGQTGAGTATYQWENSNAKGVTDFVTKASPRISGDSLRFQQDIGGDAILNVNIGLDGAYYSMKAQSAYRLFIDPTDLATGTTNEVYRRELGLSFFRGSVSTKNGIVFMNTANPSKPELIILKRNEIGTDIEPYPLFPHFKFSDYDYTDVCVDSYDRYIIVACRKQGSLFNDTVLVCDPTLQTVDETHFSARCFAKDQSNLYNGSAISESSYQLFSGFDDDGMTIENEWISKGEQYESLGIAESLKKIKKLRIKGTIDPDQKLEVWVSYDGDEFSLAGTVVGDGSYVDYNSPQSVGNNMVGSIQIGGADITTVYPFFAELKLSTPKYRKRTIKLKATGIGFVEVDTLMDRDILIFEKRLPKRFRSKQNVSLDGTQVDQ